ELRSRSAPNWNHYRITCQDGNISLAVNGKVVTQGKECSPRQGYICLESEGGIVHYRNIRIKELPDTPIAEEHVAIADRGYRCLYHGLDLTGWTVSGSESGWKSKDWILAYEGARGGADAAIATQETFGDFGFVFDIKLNEKSGAPRVKLRGTPATQISLALDDDAVSKHLAGPGKWNRIEGTLKGDKLTLTVNGELVFLDRRRTGSDGQGPLTIIPDGPLEVANLYVRSIDP
ncbi:MAG: DUF1080 domain-containing protein, partial [Planctomycetaceae bacterium]|nr:DUF1080 domain-containing protein [Planctomycetaceae bacterium]